MEDIEIYQPTTIFSDEDLEDAQEISNIFWQTVEDMLNRRQITKGDET